MIWRAGNQFLIDGPFRLIDTTGAITREYADTSYEQGDYLVRHTYFSRGDQLIERTEAGHRSHQMEDSTNDAVVLSGLVQDPSEDTARFVAIALGDHAVSVEERRLRAEARVDAIDGARQPLEHGESERARGALVDRVVRYGDDRAEELLQTLIELVRAGIHDEARDAYVRGCLLACFSSVVPALVESAAIPSPLATHVDALADRVKRDGDADAAAEALHACARMLGVP